MARLTLVFSAILIALGLVAYFVLSDPASRSVTALIPAFFGVVFAILGAVALKESLRKHAMHGAVLLTLLAMGGTGGSLPKLPAAFEAMGEPAPAATPAAPDEAPAVASPGDAVDAGEATGGTPEAEAEAPVRVNAILIQAIMFVLSTGFLVACIASFIAARKARGAAPAAG
jgi:hypothetical protein